MQKKNLKKHRARKGIRDKNINLSSKKPFNNTTPGHRYNIFEDYREVVPGEKLYGIGGPGK